MTHEEGGSQRAAAAKLIVTGMRGGQPAASTPSPGESTRASVNPGAIPSEEDLAGGNRWHRTATTGGKLEFFSDREGRTALWTDSEVPEVGTAPTPPRPKGRGRATSGGSGQVRRVRARGEVHSRWQRGVGAAARTLSSAHRLRARGRGAGLLFLPDGRDGGVPQHRLGKRDDQRWEDTAVDSGDYRRAGETDSSRGREVRTRKCGAAEE